MFKKKGISPLIATVLVIGFTVALAAIIMTWGTTFGKSMQKSSEEQANLQMICAQDVQYTLSAACAVDADTVRLTIKNDGSIDLKNLNARFFESPTDVAAVANISSGGEAGLAKYDIGVFDVDLTDTDLAGEAQDVKMVELVPIIDVNAKEVTCAQTTEQIGDVTGTAIDACAEE